MTRIVILIASLLLAATGASAADCSAYAAAGVDWSGCSKEKLMLGGENLAGANLTGAFLSGTGFEEVDLSRAILDLAEFNRASFKGANLANASLKRPAAAGSISKAPTSTEPG